MKQFLIVLKFEMGNYFKNKSFLLTTAGLMLLSVLLIAVPPLIPGLLGDDRTGQAQESSADGGDPAEDLEKLGIVSGSWTEPQLELLQEKMPADWQTFPSAEELREAVDTEKVSAGFVLEGPAKAQYIVLNNSVSGSLETQFADAMVQVQKENVLEEKGFTPEEIQALNAMQVSMDTVVLGKNSAENFLYTYVLVFLLYFIILFYGQMIAVSVTTEKSNRAIEILVTSVDPNSLIYGKVIAGALSGVIQVGLIIGAACGTYALFRDAWGNLLDILLRIPGNVLAAYAAFSLLGYLLYSLIYGALGALVSKTEDISKSSSAVTMIYLVAFFIAMFGMSNSDSLLMKVTSFIPFTAHNSMFIRIAMGSVAGWEIGLSLAILVLSCAGMGWLAGKLFRFGTLHYGNPIKLGSALKAIRRQK